MLEHLLCVFIFFMISTLSFALPPVVDELIEGIEKSLVANHPNAGVYSEQLAHVIMDAQTSLTDQAVEENGQYRIPLYYGRRNPEEEIPPIDRAFSPEPINILGVEAVPEEKAEPEKPFDHIVIHKYGFGAVCDKAQESKIIRAISALAVDYVMRKDPKIAHILNDTSKDAQFDQPVATHRALARGVFSALSNGGIKHEADSNMGRNIQRLIQINNCQDYMGKLTELINGSSYKDKNYIPFDRSPYKGVLETRSLPLTEKMRESIVAFSWIKRVTSKDVPASKMRKTVRISPAKPVFFPEKVESSGNFSLAAAGVEPNSGGVDNSVNAKAIAASPTDNKSMEADKSSEDSNVEPTDEKAEDTEDEDSVIIDEDDLECGYDGVQSTEATPKRPIPAITALNFSYSNVSSDIGNSPIMTEWEYETPDAKQ